MLKIKNILPALLALIGTSALAVDPCARMDLTSSSVQIVAAKQPAGGFAHNPGWAKDKNKFITSQSKGIKSNDWENFELSFIPAQDGKVTIELAGMLYKEKGAKNLSPIWVCWDDVTVEGAELVNGDFSKVDEKGKPVGWWMSGPALYLDNGGNKCVKVWHNARCNQSINVTAGQEVIIKAKIKKCDQTP